MAKRNYAFKYDEALMWDRMPFYQTISFSKAIQLLKSYNGEILFMSESEKYPYCHGIVFNGKEHKGVAAKANAAELAERIAFEWYEGWRLMSENMYLSDVILPEDLYVFDANMQYMIVFTHEYDWDQELEEPMKAAASRFCMAYGFDV